MAKIETRPWDPAEHIADGEDVLAYLEAITEEEYDPDVTPLFLDCIARSKGVTEITGLTFHELDDGRRSVTVTTVGGAEATIAIAPDVSLDSIRHALLPQGKAEAVSP